ncbi:MAG: hypothetical protein QOJ27_1669 [Sphingomonadales bacterium]|nr:hypothetical protein [Sphingomonadales bacterium]
MEGVRDRDREWGDQMRVIVRCALAAAAFTAAAEPHVAQAQQDAPELGGPAAPHWMQEGYPEAILRGRRIQEQKLLGVSKMIAQPFHLIVPLSQRWPVGSLVRVAFRGGTAELHAAIEAAALEWMGPDGANLRLSFRNADGSFRTWSTDDQAYEAEIRVAFDQKGRWSLVGNESVDSTLEGGGAGQTSLNLAGFDQSLPQDWRGTIIHEFGHALGFQHEHQSPAAACNFRFYNDAGYRPTVDEEGWYTIDAQERRPGLYTYLGGKANYWTRAEVDANLKMIRASSAYLRSEFDNASIMKYWFPASYFKAGEQSPCYSTTESNTLSALDLAGARQAYPRDLTERERLDRLIFDQLIFSAKPGSPLAQRLGEIARGLAPSD